MITRKKGWCGGFILVLMLLGGILAAFGGETQSPAQAVQQAGVFEGLIGKSTPGYNDYALLIAGLSSGRGPLAQEEAKPAWLNHARMMNHTWANFDRRQLAVMRQWVSRELTQTDYPTIFYPFSGPDFVNVYTLFPQARTYVMVSLEPVGDLPDFAGLNSYGFYAGLQRSLYELLQMSFFITPKLQASLGKQEVSGVLPVLLFFLARDGLKVVDVKNWLMHPDGAIEETPATTAPAAAGPGDIPGLRIVFERPGSAQTQTLYYFRFNLADDSCARNPQFISYLEKFGPVTTFAKAASYLMYRPRFAAIRQFILDQSSAVLQSDSAIPLQYFDNSAWNLRFYGCYKGPIALFSNRFQRDLAAAYQRGQGVHPLPFGICYKHRPHTSNLMLASKKTNLSDNHSAD